MRATARENADSNHWIEWQLLSHWDWVGVSRVWETDNSKSLFSNWQWQAAIQKLIIETAAFTDKPNIYTCTGRLITYLF